MKKHLHDCLEQEKLIHVYNIFLKLLKCPKGPAMSAAAQYSLAYTGEVN